MEQKSLKVGELAKLTGITVRALHHYDQLGLVKPSLRSPKGYRLYTPDDVAKLQVIRSLIHMGFPLKEIKSMISRPDFSFESSLKTQITQIKKRINKEKKLCRDLESLERAFSGRKFVPINDVLKLLKLMNDINSYYTPEEMELIKKQGEKIGAGKIKEVENEWPRLIAAVREYMDKGTDPKDPAVVKLAKRWMELVNMFTGGNLQIAKKVAKLYQEQGPELKKQFGAGVPDPDMHDYINKALA